MVGVGVGVNRHKLHKYFIELLSTSVSVQTVKEIMKITVLSDFVTFLQFDQMTLFNLK